MAKASLRKLLIPAVILLVIFLPPFAKYQRLRYKNNSIDNQIRALNEEVKRLEMEKARLEKDIAYIEKKARENIGVVRKGEIVLKEPSQQQKR